MKERELEEKQNAELVLMIKKQMETVQQQLEEDREELSIESIDKLLQAEEERDENNNDDDENNNNINEKIDEKVMMNDNDFGLSPLSVPALTITPQPPSFSSSSSSFQPLYKNDLLFILFI